MHGSHACRQNRARQSTQKPQISTRIVLQALNSSIKSSHFPPVSTSFNKSFDLFWEQRVGRTDSAVSLQIGRVAESDNHSNFTWPIGNEGELHT